jgi:hypothetical protein
LRQAAASAKKAPSAICSGVAGWILWELDRYDDFIAARKALLLDHFRALKIVPAAPMVDR